tara:strand:+ start:269 stop:1129 length:861 start_codon:yes stop_codon:yes gene_type:complete
MEGFFDSDKFLFKLDEDSGHLMPVHHRELGEKNDNLYEPGVKWSDVALNGVPLEKTFEYEDDITRIKEEKVVSCDKQGVIMVNSRPSQPLPYSEEVEDKRWVKRLERLYPMNFQEAKKKRKSLERYPVKPKGKKQVRDEKINSSSDKFQEITDEKLGGEISLDYTIYIQKKDDYKIIKDFQMRTPSDPFWPPEYNIIKRPIRTKYCPPLHWLEPEVQWENIWIHLDELKTGKKRDYHYDPDDNGYDPCIYFYDKDSDDLNYNFDWSKDYMDIQQYFGDYNDYNDYY